MIDSCSNILTGDQFYNFLTHNFYRHFDQNRAPLGLFYHAAWLKNNPEFLDAFLYWVDEVIENHPEVYFVTMTQQRTTPLGKRNARPGQGLNVWSLTAASSPQ